MYFVCICVTLTVNRDFTFDPSWKVIHSEQEICHENTHQKWGKKQQTNLQQFICWFIRDHQTSLVINIYEVHMYVWQIFMIEFCMNKCFEVMKSLTVSLRMRSLVFNQWGQCKQLLYNLQTDCTYCFSHMCQNTLNLLEWMRIYICMEQQINCSN